MNRISFSGDGKENAPTGPILSHSDEPSNETEQRIIKDLTGRYDQIEALWKQAEDDLKRFRVPHPVTHPYFTDDDGCPVHEYSLSWKRYGKAWRICHCVTTSFLGIDERSDEWEVTPITDCSLDLRINMIAEFEHLRKMVVEAAEKAVPQLDEAIASFRKVLKG